MRNGRVACVGIGTFERRFRWPYAYQQSAYRVEKLRKVPFFRLAIDSTSRQSGHSAASSMGCGRQSEMLTPVMLTATFDLNALLYV